MDSHYTYFATDGSYGDAQGLVTLDTSAFTEDDWDDIDRASDDDRRDVAMRIYNEMEI